MEYCVSKPYVTDMARYLKKKVKKYFKSRDIKLCVAQARSQKMISGIRFSYFQNQNQNQMTIIISKDGFKIL